MPDQPGCAENWAKSGGKRMFEYVTAGESHGPQVTAIIKNMPSGLTLDKEDIDEQLRRRQQGYGRGGRMDIESDSVEVKSGLRGGVTLGSPLTMIIENRDWENWREVMAVFEKGDDKSARTPEEKVTQPRPGHADLAGAIKYGFTDMRNILERASARETAARTAVGSVCREFLKNFGLRIYSHVIKIGSVESEGFSGQSDIEDFFEAADDSELRCVASEKEDKMKDLIDEWRQQGDSVGGVFEVVVTGVPAGLGSHVHWDRKLDGKLARALMSIQAIKGVEIGAGFAGAERPGSEVHDEIYYDSSRGFYRKTNNAGGFEGGMTNGEYLKLKAAMKPIPTLANPLATADFISKEAEEAARERADVCAVPSASIVGEAVTAIEIARSFADKFGGDSMEEIERNCKNYWKYIRNL